MDIHPRMQARIESVRQSHSENTEQPPVPQPSAWKIAANIALTPIHRVINVWYRTFDNYTPERRAARQRMGHFNRNRPF